MSKIAATLFSELALALAELSKRLAEIDVEISFLRIPNFSIGLGSWEIIATKGDQAFKLVFEGKDSILFIRTCSTLPDRLPDEWEKVAEIFLPARHKSEITYAETFLTKQFSEHSN